MAKAKSASKSMVLNQLKRWDCVYNCIIITVRSTECFPLLLPVCVSSMFPLFISRLGRAASRLSPPGDRCTPVNHLQQITHTCRPFYNPYPHLILCQFILNPLWYILADRNFNSSSLHNSCFLRLSDCSFLPLSAHLGCLFDRVSSATCTSQFLF